MKCKPAHIDNKTTSCPAAEFMYHEAKGRPNELTFPACEKNSYTSLSVAFKGIYKKFRPNKSANEPIDQLNHLMRNAQVWR